MGLTNRYYRSNKDHGAYVPRQACLCGKKEGSIFAAQGLFHDLRDNLGIKSLEGVRLLNRYDIEEISDDEYAAVRDIVFAEPPLDIVFEEELPRDDGATMFGIEYLPGQYDQRADSASQCIQIITHGTAPAVATGRIVVLHGALTQADVAAIKKYCINPVDSREASLDKPSTLALELETPPDVPVLAGFRAMNDGALDGMRRDLGLAMRAEDLAFCRRYFKDDEKRDPTLTEIRVLDTYWSDHCRHTTFLSKINSVKIEPSPLTKPVADAFEQYKAARRSVYGNDAKPRSLMDIATIGMKALRMRGLLDDLDASEEINACSIEVTADIDGKKEPWLVMFKNETHNHPTEIEPLRRGRDLPWRRDPRPALRPLVCVSRHARHRLGRPAEKHGGDAAGKLPQRKITTLAAQGYSSYGNQIGLATGMVSEVYDEGFVAKRMEIGAVVGAVPKANVRREPPLPGDLVLLVGGRTGRDGCGGATGSSKEHTEESITTCSAEVQKGNAPTERKIQRLFRNPEVSRDQTVQRFWRGRRFVAVGELAAGPRHRS